MKRSEKIIVAVMLIAALVAYIFVKNSYKDALYCTVKNAASEEIMRFNIYEDNYYELKGDYGTFHIEVKDGKCRAVDVECPNQTCVHTGWISVDNPVPIICLPNGIMVMIDEQN